MLNRQQMEEVIRNGGSVLHGGRVITNIAKLPSAADLATTDEEIAAAEAEAEARAKQAEEDKAKLAEKKAAKGAKTDKK